MVIEMKNIGLDIVKIDRIDELKHKEKFIKKIFTETEIEYIKAKKFSSQTISGLFACKEAVSKALGTGIGRTKWKDIEISHTESGKPYGFAKKNNKKKYYNISISHEKNYAVAIALEEDDYFSPKSTNPLFYLQKRNKKTHKGNYGRAGILGGQFGMAGAVYLAGSSCLRMGSGLVYALVPKNISNILSIKFDEVIVEQINNSGDSFTASSYEEISSKIKKYDVLGLGPGFGWDTEKKKLIERIIKESDSKLLIDADGLNCISEDINILKHKSNKIVMTPHIGEMARLTKKSTKKILENPLEISKKFAQDYNIVLVLKKNETIVASPEGEIYINKTGNPGMATAGSGDVLTGIITSLIGQGYDEFEASKIGVYIHGLAGDLAAYKYGEYSMTATDIIEFLPKASKLCTK